MHWMKNKKTWLYGIMGLLVIAGIAGYLYWKSPHFERPLEAELQVNGESFLIGDEIVIILNLYSEPGYTVELPEISMPAGIEILQQERGRQKQSWRTLHVQDKYTVTTFEPGEYQLPALTLAYTTPTGEQKDITLPAKTLVVKSLLTAESTEIRELKPLADAPTNPLIYYVLGCLAVLGIVLYLVIRYFRGRKPIVAEENTPPLPPHEIAYRQLKELLLSDWIETGQIERYFTVLSQITREYIENRFCVKAREMTTQEFLETALRRLNLSTDHQQLLKDFLNKSDLVKYARHIPHYEQIQEAYHAARRFVDETKVIEVAEVVEEGVKVNAESGL